MPLEPQEAEAKRDHICHQSVSPYERPSLQTALPSGVVLGLARRDVLTSHHDEA